MIITIERKDPHKHRILSVTIFVSSDSEGYKKFVLSSVVELVTIFKVTFFTIHKSET